MDEQEKPAAKAKIQVQTVFIHHAPVGSGLPGPLGEIRSVYEQEVDSAEQAIALVAMFNNLFPGQGEKKTGLVTANVIPPENLRNIH